MTTSNWGNLPVEIIKLIFESLDHQFGNYLQYQLVNKQWHFASLSVVYRSISINDDMVNDLDDNHKGLDSFSLLLKNSAYNIGPCVKTIHLFLRQNLHILQMLMKHCPNVELLSIRPPKDMHKCIVLLEENITDAVVWKNLKKISVVTDGCLGNSLYRYFHVFRNTLTYLKQESISNMSKGAVERTKGTEKDLCAYLGDFKNLKSLALSWIIYHVFDCERILQYSSANIEKRTLRCGWKLTEERKVLYQDGHCKVPDNYQTYPSLKSLIIWNYIPFKLSQEVLYIKNKFVNLEELRLSSPYGKPHGQPLDPLAIKPVIADLFTIPKFKVYY